ncbi:MAG: hypothetical protein LQ345_005715 [Seirophora villosa]|nr:MAG: hypothetical protein LQ345_005715 [Seirophora villosa]
MSFSSFVNIDWRDAPKTESIVAAIRRYLTKCDAEPKVQLRLESSTAPGIVALRQIDGVRMLARDDRTSARKPGANAEYWARFLKTATLLQDMVVRRDSQKMRFIQYREAGKHERLDIVKRKVMDVALTLGIHPAAFGVQQEDSGKITTPEGVTLENTTVTDIFSYEDRQRSGKAPKSLPGTTQRRMHGEHSIPLLVLDVNVKRQSSARIDAVVVVEHQNLSKLALKNVLLVMTAGFPSSATKEYLHLLSQSSKLRNVPFLYFGDHDMQGFTIFQALKYGSKNAAWGSKAMVCPQLEYAGPTRQDLKDSPRFFRPYWEAQFRADYPDATDREVEKNADRWLRRTKTKVNRKLGKHTMKDKESLKSFERLGWLDHEPMVKKEVNLIIGAEFGGKFRIADMTVVDLYYLRHFIEGKLHKKCKDRAVEKFPSPVARGARLQNTPSQFSNAPHGARNQANSQSLRTPFEGAGTQATMAEEEMAAADTVESTAPGRELSNSPQTELRLLQQLYIP